MGRSNLVLVYSHFCGYCDGVSGRGHGNTLDIYRPGNHISTYVCGWVRFYDVGRIPTGCFGTKSFDGSKITH